MNFFYRTSAITKKTFISLTLIGAIFNSSACSVYFASSGTREPDFSKLPPGTSRLLVEQELGEPLETKKSAKGETALYQYKTGDVAAPGRALLYLVGDILTLCLAEYIFFPLEISNSGNSHQVTASYGTKQQLLELLKVQEKTSVLDDEQLNH